MLIDLEEHQIYLSSENTITLKTDTNEPLHGVQLEEGVGYQIIAPSSHQCTCDGPLSFRVQFSSVGETKLKVTPLYIRRGPGELLELPIKVVSPFCDRGWESRPIRKTIWTQLDRKSQQSNIVWMWGLPQVGKTTLIRQWLHERYDSDWRNHYVDLAERTGHVCAWVARCLDSDQHNSSVVDRMWRAVKGWVSQHDSDPLLVFDHFQKLRDREILVHLYRIMEQDCPSLRLIIVDVLPYLERRKDLDREMNDYVEVFRNLSEVEIKPLTRNELRRYILNTPFPPGLAISEWQNAFREERGNRIVWALHKITWGHPALVNTYLCHTETLYEPLEGGRPETMNEIYSGIVDMNVEEKKRAADDLWCHYQEMLLIKDEEAKWLRDNIVHFCSSCDDEFEGGDRWRRRCPQAQKIQRIIKRQLSGHDKATPLKRKGAIRYEDDKCACILFGRAVIESLKRLP